MGKVKVKLFGGMVQLAGGQREVEVNSNSVREALEELSTIYGPAFRQRLLDSGGELESFIRIFVNDKDIRLLKGLETETLKGDVIVILPAIGGG